MNVKRNSLVCLTYGDKPQERICRVVEIRDMKKHPVSADTLRRRPDVDRSDTLVTCRDTNGETRSFYSGKEKSARPLNIVRAVVLKLRGKLPARV